MQASVERRLRGEQPPGSDDTLATIEVAARDTLVELRRLLGVLRKDDQPMSLAPQPRLAQLDELVEPVRAAGVAVELTIDVTTTLPAGVDLAAYRIVQEALTNVIKHADAQVVRVDVRDEDGVLKLAVADDGRGTQGADDEPGHGLVGMRERVALYGGDLTAGSREGGGFHVLATIPCAT